MLSTRVLSSVGGFLSTPPKNFSHSICKRRIAFSSASRSSEIGEATLGGLLAQEQPEERQPQLARVGHLFAVHQDLGAGALPHDVEERAEGTRLLGVEAALVADAVSRGDLAIDRRGPGHH